MMSNNRKILILLVLTASFFRLYGLNWDQGHYLHPDERLYVNASNLHLPKTLAEFLSPNSPANPKMFYYGSFPLYFYKIIQSLFFSNFSFLLTSRLIASLISIATIPLVFLIGKELFSKKIGLLAAFIFAFAPGAIQHAHFNTTESWLVFLLSAITLLSVKTLKEKNYYLLIPQAFLVGFSFATKVIGLTFILLPLFSLILIYLTSDRKSITNVFFWGVIFLLVTSLTAAFAAPYQIIDFSHFKREQEYMQGVTLGKYKPPFIIIYEGTLPYLYPLIKVLPFTFGFVSLPLALLGLVQATRREMPRVPQKGVLIASFIKQFKLLKCFGSWRSRSEPGGKSNFLPQSQASDPFYGVPSQRHRLRAERLHIILFPLLYFLWVGAWYAKFSRYYILLLPFLSLWAALALEKIPKAIRYLFLLLIALNGLLFFRIYLSPHTRIAASRWIYDNLSSSRRFPNSTARADQIGHFTLAGEHWDDNLPLPLAEENYSQYQILQLPVYDGPDDENKITRLAQVLNESDYLVLTSRRVYYSILRNREKYPATSRFYELLFAEKLGFRLVAKFTNYPYFASDDFADESFQSYDHPPVLIFKNEEKFSVLELKNKLNKGSLF